MQTEGRFLIKTKNGKNIKGTPLFTVLLGFQPNYSPTVSYFFLFIQGFMLPQYCTTILHI